MALFDFIGDLFNKDARNRAAKAQHDAIDTYKSIDPNAQTTTASDAFQNLDSTGKDAQEQAMRELQSEYQQGGMDTQSKAALQEAQMGNAQVAKGNTDAALERASSEGRLNSGRALSAQIQAEQGETNANAMAGAEAAGQAAGRGQTALINSAQVGSNLTGQAQQTAQGQNQASEYNASQQNSMAEQNIANQLGRASGVAAQDQNIAATDLNRAQQARESAGAVGDAAVKAASAAIGLSEGGVVPGKAKKDGDSKSNDTVPAKLSPGEIVIPKSVVKKGKAGIDAFIDHLLGGQ